MAYLAQAQLELPASGRALERDKQPIRRRKSVEWPRTKKKGIITDLTPTTYGL
jgi:hypothetical protein